MKKSQEPSGSRVLKPKMGPRKGGKPATPDSDDETDQNMSDDEIENVNTNKDKRQNKRMQLKKHSWVKLDALKTFRVKHKNITGLHDIVIPISNKYGLLADKMNDKKIDAKQPDKPGKSDTKRQRIPPIVLPNIERRVVTNQLKFLKVTNYRLKMTSIGINIFLDNADDYKKYRQLLNEAETKYFSHDLPEEKHTRVVLKGLDYVDPKDVAKELEALDLKPVDIKAQIPKQKRYTNHANFIVSFRRGSVDLKKVYSVRSLFNTIVRWEPYRSSFNGPTQCRRCLMPGHGTRHCTLDPNCAYCAKSHLSEECDAMGKAIDDIKTQMDVDVYPGGRQTNAEKKKISLDDFPVKCFNCVKNGLENVNHIALSDKCPSKHRFAQLQRQLSMKRTRQQQQQQTKFTIDQTAFPPLPTSKNGLAFRTQKSSERNPQPSSLSWAQKVNEQARKHSLSFQNPNPNEINGIVTDNDELFSFDEMMELVNELVGGMSRCSSRLEQFQLITNLTLRYVYGQSR